jgi:Rhodopirellula transposase DDE domain
VIEQIAQVLEHETAGDPMRDLKWRRRATGKIAQQLRRWGIQVSASTVRRLLKQMGYSLRVNHKKLESGNKNPPPRRVRNLQFRCIERQRKQFLAQGNPIISVDAKKRELMGNFKNAGACWDKQPQLVMDHDFPSDAQGVAVPYGIYDPARNQGFVVVGTSRETPAFVVDALTLWWKNYGERMYDGAKKLLILADCGGGNSARSHGWKYHLQQEFVNPHGLAVTVSHYPPGASKWNPIEHRLFCQISKNWAGQPLRDYPTALNYIRTTTTSTGLKVRAVCCTRNAKKAKDIGPANDTTCAVPTQRATDVELHAAANVNLFLRSSFANDSDDAGRRRAVHSRP